MKLQRKSIIWAIESINRYSDTDIFPKQIEHSVLHNQIDIIADELSDTDLENIKIGPSRKMVIPKDDLNYRIGTQLSYLDNIILTAIIYEFGNLIESKRIPVNANKIFSYRFDPKDDFSIYNNTNSWNQFWEYAQIKTETFNHFLLLDISDFYNQISHHTIETFLIEYGFPNQVKNWVMHLLESLTSIVSRGIPIGPHAIHLFAEAALNNIDNSLLSRGIDFVRYVDDFIIFCKSEIDARRINLIFADILDKQNKLIVQKTKTRILNKEKFIKECSKNIEDRPINDLEDKLLKIIRLHSNNDPYKIILLSELTSSEIAEFNKDVVEKIISDYIKPKKIDFIRLRWFIRRLSQVGHPAAISYLLDNIYKILPAMNDVFKYLMSIEKIEINEWPKISQDLINLMNNELTIDVDYYQLIIYSIFNQKCELNHLGILLSSFNKVPPNIQREIIILAYKNNCKDWLRELKESYKSFNIWSRNAYLVAISILPKEERKFFISNFIDKNDITQKLIANWSKQQ